GEGRDRRGRWFLGPPGPPAYYRALGVDHVTDHRRGTHRLDHLPFSARPDSGPRTHHLAPDADSRPEARSRRRRRKCRRGTPKKPVWASTRFEVIPPTRPG